MPIITKQNWNSSEYVITASPPLNGGERSSCPLRMDGATAYRVIAPTTGYHIQREKTRKTAPSATNTESGKRKHPNPSKSRHRCAHYYTKFWRGVQGEDYMRRPNGTGSIVKLSGNRRKPYMVKVSRENKYGQIVQAPLSYHTLASEAQAALDEYNNQKTGTPPKIDRLSMTVQQVYDAWSERAYKKLNPPSVISHKAAWNNRISRYANRKMREVALEEWQSILDADEEGGCSQSLIHNDAILIRTLSAYSLKHDIIVKDYSAFLEIPTVDIKKPRDAFNDIQLQLLEQLAKNDFPWADTVLMMCYTGFRITEFLTLTRFSYNRNENYLQGGIKTESGKNRIVPVHPKIKKYLEMWLAKDGETIICNEDGSPLNSKWFRETAFHDVADEIGVGEATPHWTRHTFATQLHKAGVDALTTKWLMGHSAKSDVTASYTHESLKVLTAAIRKLA